MAASSSCESNLAPTEFDFSSSTESSSGLTIAVERCPLCDGSKRTFYCRNCVNGGFFVHSKGTYIERYKEKSCKNDMLQKERQSIIERFQGKVSEIHARDKKKSEIADCKRRIEMLKLALTAAKNAKSKDKQTLERAKRENYTRVAKARKHEEKKRRIKDYIDNANQTNTQKRQMFEQISEGLAEARRNHVYSLIQYIFPVEEVKLSNDSDSMAVSTVSALRDASHTSYVRGQWVYTDGSGEAQYRIVEPTLPCSGDYTAYNLWVATSQENGGNPDNTLNHPAHRISAALCYTSQLTAILAHILDVRLPRKQPYSDFCTGEMTERQFKTSVAYLNQNVLFLCFSQKRKDLDRLDPRNTLQNISALLNCSTLGTNSSFEINQKLMMSIEDSTIFQEDDSDTGTIDEESDLTADWEEVPEEISDIYDTSVPSRTGYSSTLVSNIQTMSYSGRPSDQSQLMSSGFVSSAATSFMSLFRGGDKR